MKDERTLLLAEDNTNDAELTLAALSRCGYSGTVVTVSDGVAAMDFLKLRGNFASRSGGNPALILLDLKMPLLTGLQVLKAIRADPSLALIPVVMLTASREESDVLESYQLGVNAYVVKPIDFPQFVEAMSHLGAFWTRVNEAPPGTAGRSLNGSSR